MVKKKYPKKHVKRYGFITRRPALGVYYASVLVRFFLGSPSKSTEVNEVNEKEEVVEEEEKTNKINKNEKKEN